MTLTLLPEILFPQLYMYLNNELFNLTVLTQNLKPVQIKSLDYYII
jgi:hypothetical protein